MSLHTTEALILRTYKLNDNDRIVVFLTRLKGEKVPGSRKARAARDRASAGRSNR